MKLMSSAVFLLITLGAASPAAADIVQTFDFSGLCTDCSGTATATLVLNSSYVLGTEFDNSDFVSFTYNATNLQSTFTILPSDPDLSVDGTIPATPPGFADVDIALDGGSLEFQSFSADGSWYVADIVPEDYGTNGVWSSASQAAAPEPATIGLVGGAFAIAAGILRRLHSSITPAAR